jgi:hypothetical protein
MSKINYPASSPYAMTPQTSWYLGPIRLRVIPAHTSDKYVLVDAMYEFRPDMLSNDLYGTPAYWWVFMIRNMDYIRDPIWDLKSGMAIFVPTLDRIEKLLG